MEGFFPNHHHHHPGTCPGCGDCFRHQRTCRRTRSAPLWAMCGRLRVGKCFLHACSSGRSSHVFGLFSAVHMTAGHNALRGSGPGQKRAFDNALAHVGCPDRRIDRLCITCCSPFPTVTSRRDPTRSPSRRECDGFFVTLALGHHRPRHSGNLVGERDGCDPGGPPRQQRRKPGPMLGAMDLCIADHGERTRRKQAAQVTIPLFADIAELLLPPLELCLGTSPIQAEKSPGAAASPFREQGDKERKLCDHFVFHTQPESASRRCRRWVSILFLLVL